MRWILAKFVFLDKQFFSFLSPRKLKFLHKRTEESEKMRYKHNKLNGSEEGGGVDFRIKCKHNELLQGSYMWC